MPRRKYYLAYKFKELSPQAQRSAVEMLRDCNVDHDWWDYIYDDARAVGLEITSFALDRGEIKARWYELAPEESIEKILANHGPACETYKIAKRYESKLQVAAVLHASLCDEASEECEWIESKDAYFNELSRAYLKMLQEEYDYQTSEKAIIEAIETSEWEFDQEGNLI